MTTQPPGGTFSLAHDLTVSRIGYGAMQLAGPRAFGPPADHDAAVAVLREAVELGVTHIDTSDYYGPHTTNEVIREALHPYPEDLCIVTKVGNLRDSEGNWPKALGADELRRAVLDNLSNLGLEVLDVVNLRMGGSRARSRSRVPGRSPCSPSSSRRASSDTSASAPSPRLSSPRRSPSRRSSACRTATTSPTAWLLQRSPNVLLIPGTSSIEHLRKNVAAATLTLPDDAAAELDAIGRPEEAA